jgi:hypothetical protein
MAITNYGELKTAIGSWAFDSGSAINAADMVTLAQGYLNRKLRCRDMLKQSDLTISSGLYTLPADYLQYRLLVEKSATRRPLSFISMDRAEQIYPDRPSGLGIHWTIIGTKIRVYPTPSNQVELTYYGRIAAFSADSDTDWLLGKLPNLYLSCGQMYVADFLKDTAEAAKQKAVTDQYIDDLMAEDMASEFANAEGYTGGLTP